MKYTDPTKEEMEALHIGGVSESFLDFEEENGYGEMNIWISEDGSTSFEPTREEAKYLTKEQTDYMIKWISYSR
tara:strand:+ start:5892 stop:6113 length:222 start_codon:yes stop_codon:yes gene_type:complete